MIYATIYSRFSPRPQSEICDSNDTQLNLNRAHCGRKSYAIAHEFADPDASGDDENRPGLWDAINSLRRGMVLVVWKMDRLCRSVYLSEFIHREVSKRGARIEAVEGATHDTTPEGVLIRQVLAAFDEFTKKMIAARTSAFMRHHQRNGRSMSSAPPFGKRFGPPQTLVVGGRTVERATLIDDPAEQAVLSRIMELRQQGKGSFAIARLLNESGVPARGKRWHQESVSRILARA